ncbi:Uncharacterised protein [Bordetella pertussis]|nr:Uncharacterised protein [Bordetella pertussis]CFP58700.1 Uncharacterised protein [Bordetella pertussis]
MACRSSARSSVAASTLGLPSRSPPIQLPMRRNGSSGGGGGVNGLTGSRLSSRARSP